MLRVPAAEAVATFSAEQAPVAEVALGEVFECETHDCYGGQVDSEAVLRTELDMGLFDRATGPVFVRGVRRGDTIRVGIEEITVRSPGIMMLAPGLGVLGELIADAETRLVPVARGEAEIADGVTVRIRPMVGVLGVAPPTGAKPCFWPGDHGGNLDTRVLGAGTALHLRVAHDGALLGVGDLHALQGDGELGGTGIESGGSVRLRVDRSAHSGSLPAIEHAGGLSICGSAETLEEATRRAFAEAVELMVAWHDLTWADAYRLTSIVCRTELSQMVNPLVTMRVTIPTEWLPSALRQGPGE